MLRFQQRQSGAFFRHRVKNLRLFRLLLTFVIGWVSKKILSLNFVFYDNFRVLAVEILFGIGIRQQSVNVEALLLEHIPSEFAVYVQKRVGHRIQMDGIGHNRMALNGPITFFSPNVNADTPLLNVIVILSINDCYFRGSGLLKCLLIL